MESRGYVPILKLPQKESETLVDESRIVFPLFNVKNLWYIIFKILQLMWVLHHSVSTHLHGVDDLGSSNPYVDDCHVGVTALQTLKQNTIRSQNQTRGISLSVQCPTTCQPHIQKKHGSTDTLDSVSTSVMYFQLFFFATQIYSDSVFQWVCLYRWTCSSVLQDCLGRGRCEPLNSRRLY